MELWKESQIKQLTFAKEIDSAYPILEQFVKNIGSNYCGFTIIAPQRNGFKTLSFNNFPALWNNEYEENNYCEVDPVISHCNHSMLPVVWSPQLYAKAPELWLALQEHGLQHGWSQSFHHEESGLCGILSLARPHCPISSMELYEHFGYMFYFTSLLSEMFARTLPTRPDKAGPPRLSAREIEVLKLCACGKTADEVGIILSISARTANFHVRKAMDKLNVCNKISAVIAAAKAGLI